jgi:TPR repeat protein
VGWGRAGSIASAMGATSWRAGSPSQPGQVKAKRYSDTQLREKADEACVHGLAAACFDFQRPPLFTNQGISIAYRKVGLELLACMAEGGTACTPSADARDALSRAQSRAVSDAREAAEANVVDLGRKCDANDASACSDLTRHYLEGTDKDPVRGGVLARRACDLGSAAGCFDVARLHGSGDGVPRDEARALAANARAEELALREACSPTGDLATCVQTGGHLNASSAARATALAPDMARRACDTGAVPACLDVAPLGHRWAVHPAGSGASAEYHDRYLALSRDACAQGTGSGCLVIAESLDGRHLGNGRTSTRRRATRRRAATKHTTSSAALSLPGCTSEAKLSR